MAVTSSSSENVGMYIKYWDEHRKQQLLNTKVLNTKEDGHLQLAFKNLCKRTVNRELDDSEFVGLKVLIEVYKITFSDSKGEPSKSEVLVRSDENEFSNYKKYELLQEKLIEKINTIALEICIHCEMTKDFILKIKSEFFLIKKFDSIEERFNSENISSIGSIDNIRLPGPILRNKLFVQAQTVYGREGIQLFYQTAEGLFLQEAVSNLD